MFKWVLHKPYAARDISPAHFIVILENQITTKIKVKVTIPLIMHAAACHITIPYMNKVA